MQARVVTKRIKVEEREFVVYKYNAMDGLKIAKLLLAKVLPAFEDFMPVVKKIVNGSDKDKESENVLDSILDNLSLDTIAQALDKVSEADFDYIVTKSLTNTFENLPAGEAPVMYSNGTYGIEDIEFDPLLVFRLTCEAVLWGCSSFFDGNRLGSIMSPLFRSSQQNP